MRKLCIVATFILRGLILALLLISSAVFTLYRHMPAFNQSAGSLSLASVSATTLGELTNKERARAHMSTLEINPLLNRAAEEKARDMATRGYFSHYSPEGHAPWVWLEQAGYKYMTAGENLAVSFTRSEAVIQAWMNSPLHRANIERSNFTQMGIGVARGNYRGRDSIFVAQFFARPLETGIAVEPTLLNRDVDSMALNTLGSIAFTGQMLLLPLASLIAFALLIVLVSDYSRSRRRLMINGIVALILVGGLLWFNSHLEQFSPLVSYLETI